MRIIEQDGEPDDEPMAAAPRRTLQELALQTLQQIADAGGGLRCPRCHCRDTRVIKTRHNVDGTETNRRRVCRNCGERISTVEISVG